MKAYANFVLIRKYYYISNVEKTGTKPHCIRTQIMDFEMVSVWSSHVYALQGLH